MAGLATVLRQTLVGHGSGSWLGWDSVWRMVRRLRSGAAPNHYDVEMANKRAFIWDTRRLVSIELCGHGTVHFFHDNAPFHVSTSTKTFLSRYPASRAKPWPPLSPDNFERKLSRRLVGCLARDTW